MTATIPDRDATPDARARFEALTSNPPAGGDDSAHLAEAALWIAAEAYPRLDVSHYLALLGALAERARRSVDAAAPVPEQVEQLNHVLFDQERFTGSREHYSDPRNSFLNEVLERRLGIPISLSIVYLDVARRIGLDVAGICFPGHFLVKVKAPNAVPVIVDAFGAQTLEAGACEGLLKHVLGDEATMQASYLASADPNEILARMLGNLKQIYTRDEDFDQALACCERMVTLLPNAPIELRDRGLIYHRLECFGAAVEDLERFLQLAPEHDSAHTVRQLLEPLRVRVRQLH